MSSPLLLENVWLQQHKYEDAELSFRQTHSGSTNNTKQQAPDSLAQEIARVRQDIQKVLNSEPVEDTDDFDDKNDAELFARIEVLERQNKKLWKLTDALKVDVSELKAMIANLGPDIPLSPGKPQETSAPSPAKPQETSAPSPAKPQKPAAADDDDDDIDLFGSDDEETKTLKEKRLREYAEKKAKKPALIAKSSVVLDVKPWDDETDMAEMEKRVRSIAQDGLVWGASKLVEVGYGIKKLSIICVVEDDKVSIEDLSEKITDENEDLVQSVDVAAFNKI